MSIAEFAYNNAKNANIGYTSFELNCSYYLKISFKEDVDPRLRSCSVNKLVEELRELMKVCCQNLFHAQELQKRPHDKGVKNHSYALSEKVWLNSKYIKMKRNKKLESKFFGPFQFFYVVRKQAYKLELLIKWKIHNVFHISLLEQDITKKEQVDNKALPEPEKDLKFGARGDKDYEIKAIINSTMYGQQANNN